MEAGNIILRAQDLSINRGSSVVVQQLNFSVYKGALWAIVGASGSGKTSLLEAIAGRLFFKGTLQLSQDVKRVLVPQQHRFTNKAHVADFYYQQRFNATDAEETLTVAEAYPQLFANVVAATATPSTLLFSVEELKERRLIQLSNGENKRLQLALALLHKPGLLLLDQPFTGLDAAARATLEHILSTLEQHGIAVLMTTTPQRIPSFITHVLELKGNEGAIVHDVPSFLARQPQEQKEAPLQLPPDLLQGNSFSFDEAVRMNHVQVRYGNKQVLQDISWTVKRGERWLLSGPNGAGKSTLLSLITADNPQAYANEVYLFGKRRGTGETIWDVKRNIGYVSPELHLYFDAGASVFDAVASGLFDTIGLFRQLTKEQEQKVMQLLAFLELTAYRNRLLAQLPLGWQRITLLARALVKMPPLLILDEPLQGLDETQSRFFNNVVDALCAATDQTLLYVSHYTNELPLCINRHLRLEDGRQVASGGF